MTWWLTLLIALIGASGGVIGGWLSGRIASRATLRAVREERSARERTDYLVAVGAFQQACSQALSFATAIPPERAPNLVDKLYAFPTRLAAKITEWIFSERDRVVMSNWLIGTSVTYRDRRLPVDVAFDLLQSPYWEESVTRRIDTFLEAANRVRSLAPPSDLEILRRAESFVVGCIRNPPRQETAFAEWEPLRTELDQLFKRAYARVAEQPDAASDEAQRRPLSV